jgi:hypothetical protein
MKRSERREKDKGCWLCGCTVGGVCAKKYAGRMPAVPGAGAGALRQFAWASGVPDEWKGRQHKLAQKDCDAR